MMKSEFEALAKTEVTDEQWNAIHCLYMESSLNKQAFVRSINSLLKYIKKPDKKKLIKRVAIKNQAGFYLTPNGCYHYIKYVNVLDIDIVTGTYIVEELPEKYLKELMSNGVDVYYSTGYDMYWDKCKNMDAYGRIS